MNYLKVVNWNEFQHYKDRNPPWIKLHNQLLENYDFTCLPDSAKSHLFGIWLIASRTDNNIPANPNWIAQKIGATEPVNIDVLIKAGFIMYHDASNVLAERSDNCTVTVPLGEERERQRESRAETKRRFTPPTFQEVTEYCSE